ncbi:MAG: ABC transporter ATP-binding protein/permease [Bacilli bacterium]|jgi:ATP-binding cassette subfamily B protein|nr:ABC transporter ATP-binding protein/permease [Bacilli bacterium]
MFKILKFLAPMWWRIIIVVALVAGQAYLQLLIPDYMQRISEQMYAFQNGSITRSVMVDNIWHYGLIMIAITFGFMIIAVLAPFFNTRVATEFGANLRSNIFKHVQEVSLHEYQKFGTASLLTRIVSDVRNVQDVVQMGIRIIIQSPMILIIAIIKVIPLNVGYLWLIGAGVPIILLAIGIIFHLAIPLFSEIQERLERVTLLLRQDLTGVRVVRAFNQQERENKFFDKANHAMTDTIAKVGRTMSFLGPVVMIVMNVMFVAVFLVSFFVIDKQVISESTMNGFASSISVSMYVSQIMMSMLMLAVLFIMVPRASASATRINSVLVIKNSITNPINPKDSAPEVKGLVEFEHVTFQFPDSQEPTLVDVNFVVPAGTTTAIIGSTGSGKSSIINLIPRFYDISGGSLKIDGVDVREYNIEVLRDKIGFVPQQALLFSGSIRSNLLFGNSHATDEDIWRAIEVAQAEHFVKEKPEGLDSEVAQGGKNFSGGQKQRLAIARALVKKPEIYIFDDSFSALDFKTDIRLRSALKNYTENSAVIIVGQRVSSIMDADQIVVLDDGKVVGIGKHNALLRKCKVYQEIVASQLDPDEVEKTKSMTQDLLAAEGGDR